MAVLGSLLIGAVAVLIHCDEDAVRTECGTPLTTTNFFYAFRMPHHMSSMESSTPPRYYTKFGFSNMYAFFDYRYEGEYRFLASKCLLEEANKIGKPLSGLSTKSELVTVSSSQGFWRLIDDCVRRYMIFHGGIQCYHTQKCMDRKFICAIEKWNAALNNFKIQRVPLSQITVGFRSLWFNPVLPTVDFLNSGSTETWVYGADPATIPYALSELFTNSKYVS